MLMLVADLAMLDRGTTRRKTAWQSRRTDWGITIISVLH
jgi:hypothetical protein